MIRTRLSMGRKQARCKNQIKSMLLFYGVVIPERREMGHWSRRFIRWIEGIRMERASGDLALQIHVEELCHIRQILAKLNRAILALARTEQPDSILPKVLSSKGYYEIKPEGKEWKVNYFEEVRLGSKKPIS